MIFYYINKDQICEGNSDDLYDENLEQYEMAIKYNHQYFVMTERDWTKVGWFPIKYLSYTCWFDKENIKKDDGYKEYCRIRKQTIDNQIEYCNSKIYTQQLEIQELIKERKTL
jgi:hypothetical protein